MNRRTRLWLAVAAIFTAINLAGAVVAGAQGEMLHTGIHVVLMLLGGFFVWRLASPRDARSGWHRKEPADASLAPPESELAERFTHLEQAIDAVAIEVERVGEWQRYLSRSFNENRDPPPAVDATEQAESEVRAAPQSSES